MVPPPPHVLALAETIKREELINPLGKANFGFLYVFICSSIHAFAYLMLLLSRVS
jgi:hypothetical protein